MGSTTIASVGGASVAPTEAPLTHDELAARRTARLGARLHPSATETCVDCLQPIGRHEYVRAVMCGPTTDARLLGFVHVELCSPRLAHRLDYYAEFIAINARMVDLG